MSENTYSTIILSAGDASRQKSLLLAIAGGAIIFISLHIYFLYGLVSFSHSLESGQKEFLSNEYAYQEADMAYQGFLRDVEKEYVAEGPFSGIGNPEFISPGSSLVFR